MMAPDAGQKLLRESGKTQKKENKMDASKLKIIGILTGPDFAEFLHHGGEVNAIAIRESLEAGNGNAPHAQAEIYAAIARTANNIGYQRSGRKDREAAAQRILAAWPKSWSKDAQAAIDPIFV
jgi:hypothetical protein